MSTPDVTTLTRAEMEALLDARFPDMAPNVREAACTGSLLRLRDGTAYRVPTRPEDQKATHFIDASIERIGTEWTQ